MRLSARQKRITPREAEKAVYLDFEGTVGRAPGLVGVKFDGLFEQICLWSELESAATSTGIRMMEIRDFGIYLSSLVEKGRCIVGFTSHENTMLEQFADIQLGDSYRDAHKIIKRWMRLNGPRLASWDLQSMAQSYLPSRPAAFRAGNAASRLRAVTSMLETRRSFEALTPVVKAKWTKLLRYNEMDVVEMEQLVRLACGAVYTKRATCPAGVPTGFPSSEATSPRRSVIFGRHENTSPSKGLQPHLLCTSDLENSHSSLRSSKTRSASLPSRMPPLLLMP